MSDSARAATRSLAWALPCFHFSRCKEERRMAITSCAGRDLSRGLPAAGLSRHGGYEPQAGWRTPHSPARIEWTPAPRAGARRNRAPLALLAFVLGCETGESAVRDQPDAAAVPGGSDAAGTDTGPGPD